jgi:tRNA(adenine34) deaminase
MDYEDLMRRAVALARRASAGGETAVGALVGAGADIIGEGEESVRRRLDPSAHAEVVAIRDACQRRG